MLPLYEQELGQKIYLESLGECQNYFPQYVIELQGMADGAGVEFHMVRTLILN